MKDLRSFKKYLSKIRDFFIIFFEKSPIHGLYYFSLKSLVLIEKIFWLTLVISSLYFCIIIGLESLERYNTKSTVVSIEKDHYYWNTSLPSLTVCPMQRISQTKFDMYCKDKGIDGEMKENFYEFLESLANSSYLNFQDIKDFDGLDALNIRPRDYMELIYQLTDDLTLADDEDHRVRTLNNLEFIHCRQVLTEYGICYTTNNFLIDKLSTSLLITGKPPPENMYETQIETTLHDVRFGNLFDGDITYSFIGFDGGITMFLHSPYDTMDIARNSRYATDAFEFEVYSMEIVVSEDFEKDTTISQRGCRFRHESNLTHYQVYTKGICLQECRLNLAYEKCKCIPHFYPNRISNPKPVCHYKTLKLCFPKYKDLFLEFHEPTADGVERTVSCNCLQNCQESKVTIEKVQMMEDSTDLLGSIGGLVVVKKYPVIRFKRQILFTFTDLLVSIGGTAGFFLGFSVLGAVEIIYFFTLRFFWYIKGRK